MDEPVEPVPRVKPSRRPTREGDSTLAAMEREEDEIAETRRDRKISTLLGDGQSHRSSTDALSLHSNGAADGDVEAPGVAKPR